MPSSRMVTATPRPVTPSRHAPSTFMLRPASRFRYHILPQYGSFMLMVTSPTPTEFDSTASSPPKPRCGRLSSPPPIDGEGPRLTRTWGT